MQIDRSNYEIWIIDWLDGNLNSLQVEQLMLFLDQNPDLKEEFNDIPKVRIAPSSISYPNKEHLKKSPSDILQSQFEYLCTAYLENDLSVRQETELKELVKTSPDRKKTFDQLQKTKLVPKIISYRYKSLLLKPTPVQKIIRLSVIGLSTAAAVSLIIILYRAMPAITIPKLNISSHNLVSDSLLQRSSPKMVMDLLRKDSIITPVEKTKASRIATTGKVKDIISDHPATGSHEDYLPAGTIDKQEMEVKKIPAHKEIDLMGEIASFTLIASNPAFKAPDAGDERSKVRKLISKTFREKILKEKSPADKPLKGYEIAGAGVSGLNKLFGWQMALETRNDGNGQPESVSFKSGILKITAPVKKREPQP
jgi:hypothetical protein